MPFNATKARAPVDNSLYNPLKQMVVIQNINNQSPEQNVPVRLVLM